MRGLDWVRVVWWFDVQVQVKFNYTLLKKHYVTRQRCEGELHCIVSVEDQFVGMRIENVESWDKISLPFCEPELVAQCQRERKEVCVERSWNGITCEWKGTKCCKSVSLVVRFVESWRKWIEIFLKLLTKFCVTTKTIIFNQSIS